MGFKKFFAEITILPTAMQTEEEKIQFDDLKYRDYKVRNGEKLKIDILFGLFITKSKYKCSVG